MHAGANTSITHEPGDVLIIDVVFFVIFALVIKIAALIVNRMAKEAKRLFSWFVYVIYFTLSVYSSSRDLLYPLLAVAYT